MNKKNIAIFGSCMTIDPFRSYYNDYKRYFNKKFVQQKSTIISLMSPKFEYNSKDIVYYTDDENLKYISSCFKMDFDRSLLNNLNSIDYLIIDVFNDVRWGILEFEDNKIVTYSEGYIEKLNFFKENKKIREINITNYRKEFINLRRISCDSFFKFMNESYPNIKIILNRCECVEWIHTKDNTYVLETSFSKDLYLNEYIHELEEFIIENYDVNVINFPKNICADENNIWGPYSVHYVDFYYNYVFSQLKNIVFEDIIFKNEEIIQELNTFKIEVLKSRSWKITKIFRTLSNFLLQFKIK